MDDEHATTHVLRFAGREAFDVHVPRQLLIVLS